MELKKPFLYCPQSSTCSIIRSAAVSYTHLDVYKRQAETCVFGKQLPGPLYCGLNFLRHPLSRSYGVILPSSLTIVLSLTLGYSPCPPVSVLGTGTYIISPRNFSWKLGVIRFRSKLLHHHTSALSINGFPY